MKVAKCLLAVCLFGIVGTVQAQLQPAQVKERQKIQKASREALDKSVSKAAKKECKALKKAGWTVSPGGLPLEKQLDRTFSMQMEYDELLFPKYIMGEGMSIGENYDAAKMQAIEIAKQNVVGQIQTEITALVENSVANEQLSQEEAASVVKSVMASKTLISQSLGRLITAMEVYRTLPNKNKEVLVRVAYNGDMAKAAAKNAVRNDLKQEAGDLHQKLDDLLGW